MTDRDTINRVLAERVMGWTMGNISTKVEPDKNLDVWRDSNWSHIVFANVWDPMDNIAQAMRVAEKLGLVMALYRETAGNGWYWVARINKGADFMYDSLAEAISRAAYEVVKGEQ